MGSLKSVLEDWSEGDPKRAELLAQYPGVVLRWINEAQLRYCDKSEILQDVWEPSIPSSGTIALPSDFLREYKDRVKWTDTRYLVQIDYPTANLRTWSDVTHYSIFEGSFFVWAASAGSPSIPYIKKPVVVAIADISTADLETPTEFQHNLLVYLDAMYARRSGAYVDSKQILRIFDEQAIQDGFTFRARRDPSPIIRGSWF